MMIRTYTIWVPKIRTLPCTGIGMGLATVGMKGRFRFSGREGGTMEGGTDSLAM